MCFEKKIKNCLTKPGDYSLRQKKEKVKKKRKKIDLYEIK
jgi:hypothetical protein